MKANTNNKNYDYCFLCDSFSFNNCDIKDNRDNKKNKPKIPEHISNKNSIPHLSVCNISNIRNFSNSLNKIIVFVLFLILIQSIKTEFPVHCSFSQIKGDWRIVVTDLYEINSNKEMNCGFHSPSNDYYLYSSKIDKISKVNTTTNSSNLSFNNEFTLYLKQDYSALLKDSLKYHFGFWTIVYDQGLQAVFDDITIFAYFKYSLNTDSINDYFTLNHSICNKTQLGWFRKTITRNGKEIIKGGCFYAEKIAGDRNKSNDTDSKIKDNNTKGENDIVSKYYDTFSISDFYTNKYLFNSKCVVKYSSKNKIHNNNEINNKVNSSNSNINNDTKRINRDESIIKVSVRLSDITTKNKFNLYKNQSNIKRFNTNSTIDHRTLKDNFIEDNYLSTNNEGSSANVIVSYSSFMIYFLDKTKTKKIYYYLNTDKQYLDCPLNYSHITSVLIMLSMRLNITLNIIRYFDISFILNCNYYSQGEESSQPFVNLKFINENYLKINENSKSNEINRNSLKNSIGKCDLSLTTKNKNYSISSDYGYIESSYNKELIITLSNNNDNNISRNNVVNNARDILSHISVIKLIEKELLKRGPIVCGITFNCDYKELFTKKNFKDDYSFLIYLKKNTKTWLTEKKKKPHFTKTHLYLVITGYGKYDIANTDGSILESIEYWEVLNTFISSEIDNQFLFLPKGLDFLGIETNCVFANTSIPKSLDS